MSRILNPLTAADLLPSISRLWNNELSKQASHGLARIGVCVSGGPDSMALAYLLKQVPLVDRTILVEPLAFIVNHNARKGSEEEANFVSAELGRLAIESVILNMEWPANTSPSTLPDFEMRAREMRYQLIARAAIRRRINHLFVGHHQDDQVETVLMRMLRNSPNSFLGLQGMAEQTAIPCCEGIRGAHEEAEHPPDIKPGERVAISQPGGLRLHRPLLGFPKSQFVKTCLDNDIQFVNDKTNHDPTLTLRNAIRYLRTNCQIPRALQAESILQLQDWAHKSSEALLGRGTRLLRRFKVKSLDLRTGVMMATVSKDVLLACKADPEAARNALARLTSVVSCQSKDVAPMLVPRHNLEEFLQKMEFSKSNKMTIQQVLLERMQTKPEDGHEEVMWRLSRPPMRATEVEHTKQYFTPATRKPPTEAASLSWSPSPAVEKENGLWSEWALWDHRYWIRVKTRDPSTTAEFQVRPYQKSDEAMLRERFPKEWSSLQHIFAEAAPQTLRFTLPILTYKGQIQAFATLNVVLPTSLPDINIPLNRHLALEWEVCYKSMDQPFISEQQSTIEWRNVQVSS